MKIRYSLLSLAVVAIALTSQTATANAQPVTESKYSECQRFEAAMVRFNDRFTAKENDRNTQREMLENLLVVLKTEIKQLEIQKFSDAKIQAFHQQALDSIIAVHNNMTEYLHATDRGDRPTAETAYGNMQLMPYQISDVAKQFESYCNKP